jgi:two-component system, OmpR family, phosphate regulon sensor histidine kinase PhoR
LAINWNSKVFKNLNLNKVSLIAAAILGVTIFCVTTIMVGIGLFKMTLGPIFFISLACFVVSVITFNILLHASVYRRLKVIYRLINDQKKEDTQKLTGLITANNLFDMVEADVNAWLDKKNNDMIALSKLEDYRREYIGNVSHELKTPIFNIQGYIQTLINGAINDPEVNSKFLEKALSNAERLQTIVEDLEAISRLESNQSVWDLQSFDIQELVEEVFGDLEETAKQKNISMTFKSGADQKYQVQGEREQIRLVLNNLIQNSIKYGETNGKTKVSFYDMDTKILIEVSDDGIGIPEDHHKFIFDRFYRVDKSRSREMGGSGLGLSIVKHILEYHGQTINVRSTPGKGSTFSFTLNKVN